jgi:hypothetical protein
LIRSYQRDRAGDMPGPITFSPSGKMLFIGHSRHLGKLQDAASMEELATLESPYAHQLAGCAFSPDGGAVVVSTSTHGIELWDLRRVRSRLEKMGLDWPQPPYEAIMARDKPFRFFIDSGAAP